MPRRKDPRISDAVLDQLLAGADPKTVFDPNGLLDEPLRPFRARAVELPRQSCDLQSLMGDEGFIFGGPGRGDRQFCFDPRRPLALGDQQGQPVHALPLMWRTA